MERRKYLSHIISFRSCKMMLQTKYHGKYFERLFLSLTDISDARNKNHPLRTGPEIIVVVVAVVFQLHTLRPPGTDTYGKKHQLCMDGPKSKQ